MLKVIQFIHGLNMGGAETLVKNYALMMNPKKFDTTILCLEHCNSPYEKVLSDAGIKVIYICDLMNTSEKKGVFYKILKHYLRFYYVKKEIHRLSPDIIHTHLTLNQYIKYARPDSGTRIFYTQHNDVLRWQSKWLKDVKALKWITKHYQTRLIALNIQMKQELDKLFGQEIVTILNNGINQSLYQHPFDKVQKRNELCLPKDAFIIVHVGRFSPIKNHNFLVDVFAEIKKKEKNAFLLLIGKGETENAVVKKLNALKLKNSYKILHDRIDVPQILQVSDAALFPSFSEGLPLTLVEMQVAELPCIVSDTITKDVCISNKICYKSLKESPLKWAEKLIELVASKEPIQYNNLEEWDLHHSVRCLERMYEGEQ